MENKEKIIKENEEVLVRISGYDIPGNKGVYVGLTKIKGVSWSISNIICNKFGFEKI